jgi:hypothetical protein
VEAWDWSRTWLAWPPGTLLTVSKNPKDGGRYRSLKNALADAKPWGTIRVLDDATYPEAVVLDRPDRHQGIVVEAPMGATIRLPGSNNQGVTIENVPHVRIKGFRFRSRPIQHYLRFIMLSGHCPGVVLTGLNMKVNAPTARAILLQGVRISPDEDPLWVRNCTIRAVGETLCDGITVMGPGDGDDSTDPSGGIAIRENRIEMAVRGILVQGNVARTHVTGNLLSKCKQSALQVQDLEPGCRQILIANNTASDNQSGFRVWNSPPFKEHQPGQVELSNNLLVRNEFGDMAFFLGLRDGGGEPGNGRPLIRLWRFRNNWRDLSGEASFSLPRAPGDTKLTGIALPTDPGKPDFMRPANKSPLATGGAGKEDPSLPTYVGAVPPDGAKAWDWDRTWRDRARRARALGIEGSKKPPSAAKQADAKK